MNHNPKLTRRSGSTFARSEAVPWTRRMTLIIISCIAFAPSLAAETCELTIEAEELMGRKLSPGTQVELRVEAARPCYLVLIRQDAHGVTELALPEVGPGGPLLPAGQPIYLPVDAASQNLLTARLPYGPSSLSVLGYVDEIPERVRELLATGTDPAYAMLAASDAAKAGDLLRGATDRAGSVAVVTRLPYEVIPAEGAPSYTAEEVVRYFSETTRSIESPKLDVYVNFALNADRPLPASEAMLDLWGQVLSDPLLNRHRFRVGGHTDDLGPETLNEDLSLRRAQAVKDALVRRYGIDPSRLEVAGYGSHRPLVDSQDERSRAANRRVDFERLGVYGH